MLAVFLDFLIYKYYCYNRSLCPSQADSAPRGREASIRFHNHDIGDISFLFFKNNFLTSDT